jgi:hypothetical protein
MLMLDAGLWPGVVYALKLFSLALLMKHWMHSNVSTSTD